MNNLESNLETLEEFKTEIKIKQIIMVKSASYQYLEVNLDKNLLLEANNNVGKTSILNCLQFLLLPEITLNNINTKFALKSGKDKKSYTAEQTYDYYFGEKNGFIIFEIENKNKTFCVLLTNRKKTSKEYKRIIADIEFKKIRHLFINEQNKITNYDEELILKELKELSNFKTIELKTTEDVKKYLFNSSQTAEFSIIPLKDNLKNTVDNFSVLFKSLYDINSMGNKEKIKLVADIIKSKKSKNENNNENELKFNIAHTQEEYTRIEKKSKYLENLNNFKDYFDFIEENLDNTLLSEKTIKVSALQLYSYLLEEKSDLIKISNKKRELRSGKEKIIEESRNDKEKYVRSETENKINLKNSEEKLAKIIKEAKYLLSKLEIKIEYTENENNYENIIKALNSIIEKRELINDTLSVKKRELSDSIDRLEQTKIDKLNNKSLVEKKILIQNNIKEFNKIIENIVEKENNLSKMLINNNNFNEEEKSKLKLIFTENIRILNSSLLEDKDLIIIKELLKTFEIKNNDLLLSGEKVSMLPSSGKDEIEMLREKKEYYIKQLEIETQKDEELIVSNSNEQNLKDIEEIKITITNKNQDINDISRLQKIIFDIEGMIPELKQLPALIDIYKKELENISNQLSKIIKRYEDLTNDLERLEEEIQHEEKVLANIKSHIFQLKDNNNLNKLFHNLGDIETAYQSNIFTFPKLNTINEEIETKKIINNANNYFNKIKELENSLNQLSIRGILDDFDEDTKGNIKLNEYGNDSGLSNFKKLYSFLKEEYSILKEREEENEVEKKQLASETNNSLNILSTAKRDILNFEKEINKKFEEIKISNLKGVKIEFKLNKELTSIIDKFHNKFSNVIDTKLDFLEDIMLLNRYLVKHLDNKNEINIESLISSVDYKIIKEFDLDENGNRINEVLIETTQSNGTETMIMIIFISILLKGLYRKGYSVRLPILIDEIQNIDINNLKSLLENINEAGNVIVGATPSASADFRNEFYKTITLDAMYSKEILDDRQKLIVLHNSLYSMFENEKIMN